MKNSKRIGFIITASLLGFSDVYSDTIHFNIIGLAEPILKNATSRLELEAKSYGTTLSPENIAVIYQRAPEEIQKAVQPYGYFNATVSSSLRHANGEWQANFVVHPGPAVIIKRINLVITGPGSEDAEINKVRLTLPIQENTVFTAENYDQAKNLLLQTANDRGYVKATFTDNKIFIDRKQHQASIDLNFETGEKYYFGDFHFKENAYSGTFLQRFVPYHANESFSSQKLLQLQQDMGSSYYFRQVSLVPDFNNIENNRIPVNVDTTLPKSQAYTFGLGYGTFTGPRLTAGVNFRRLTDTGQHFDAQLKLSSVLSALAAKYYIPGKNPLTDFWTIGVNWQRFMPKNGNSNSQSASFGYLTKFKDVQASLNLNYLLERYNVIDKPYIDSKLLYPNLNLSYTKTDDLLNPTSGKSISLNLQGAYQPIFSSTTFLQAELKGKYLFSPASFNAIMLRGSFGYTVVHDMQQLPLSMRFFAGGLNSIRGFGDSSIGPGRYLGTASVEYRNKIVGNWNAALFYDLGNASDHFGGKMDRGDGIGIVYNSVIGPVRLYGARAESKPDKPKSIEFSLGPEF